MPISPRMFTTANEIPMSCLSLVIKGANEAIAEEPQMAVPKPTSQPVLPGQLNFLDKNKVINKTNATVAKSITMSSHPKLIKLL